MRLTEASALAVLTLSTAVAAYGYDDLYARDVEDLYARDYDDIYAREVEDLYARDYDHLYARDTEGLYARDTEDLYARDVNELYAREAYAAAEAEAYADAYADAAADFELYAREAEAYADPEAVAEFEYYEARDAADDKKVAAGGASKDAAGDASKTAARLSVRLKFSQHHLAEFEKLVSYYKGEDMPKTLERYEKYAKTEAFHVKHWEGLIAKTGKNPSKEATKPEEKKGKRDVPKDAKTDKKDAAAKPDDKQKLAAHTAKSKGAVATFEKALKLAEAKKWTKTALRYKGYLAREKVHLEHLVERAKNAGK